MITLLYFYFLLRLSALLDDRCICPIKGPRVVENYDLLRPIRQLKLGRMRPILYIDLIDGIDPNPTAHTIHGFVKCHLSVFLGHLDVSYCFFIIFIDV